MPRPRPTEPPPLPADPTWRRRPSDPPTIAYALQGVDLWRRVEDRTGPRVFHRVARRPWVPESDDRAPMSGWREVRPDPSAAPSPILTSTALSPVTETPTC
jgi:hypothetical protein